MAIQIGTKQMKKINKIILIIFGGMICLLIMYSVFMPSIITQSMKSNYISNKKEFNDLRNFLLKNDSIIFPNNSHLLSQNKFKDSITILAKDSLNGLLDNISCINIIKESDFIETKSVKIYTLIYHDEFLFAPYAYKIGSNNESLKKIYKPDGFYDFIWLDEKTVAGTLSWN
jgi:hypothetical protein